MEGVSDRDEKCQEAKDLLIGLVREMKINDRKLPLSSSIRAR